MEDDTKRTQIAAMGMGLADLFTHSLSQRDVGGFTPVLREPASNSTGGGRAALQHVVLQPGDTGASVVTVGSVNVATKEARLRSFDCLVELQAQRFPDRAFPIARGDYDAFFIILQRFAEAQRMRVEIETRPPQVSGRPPAPSSSSSPWILVALVVTIVLAAGIFLALR